MDALVLSHLRRIAHKLIPLLAAAGVAYWYEAAARDPDPMLGLPASVTRIQGAPPATAALGKRLFFDTRFSADAKVSCATCHQPDRAFSDGKPVATGTEGRAGTRNAPSLINAAFLTTLFWDGRRRTLEEQARDPFVNPNEHGLADEAQLLDVIARDPAYRQQFADAFAADDAVVDIDHVTRAIAAFVRTLVAGNSPFDRYYFGGDASALSASAINGLAIFRERGQCANCHRMEKDHALFTDHDFHTLAVGLDRISGRLAQIVKRAPVPGDGLDRAVLADVEVAELGRFLVTGKPSDIGKFRTPSLRNVALTAPYMHDGSIATLEQTVEREIYYRGLEANRPLVLTTQQKRDLVEFLRSLTSDALPN